MDTTDYPSLPKLAWLHAQLATNSRKVEAVVDAQLDGIERLFHATTAEDWQGVAQASRYLANRKPEEVGPDVVHMAHLVYEELRRDPKATQPPQHLSMLLDACRKVRHRTQ